MFDPQDPAANEAARSTAAQAYLAPLRAGLNRTNKLDGFLAGWEAAVEALAPSWSEGAFRAALLPVQEAALARTAYSPAAQARYRQLAANDRDRHGTVLLPFPCLNCNAAPADERGHCSPTCEQAFDRG